MGDADAGRGSTRERPQVRHGKEHEKEKRASAVVSAAVNADRGSIGVGGTSVFRKSMAPTKAAILAADKDHGKVRPY